MAEPKQFRGCQNVAAAAAMTLFACLTMGCSPKYGKAEGTRVLAGSYTLNFRNNCAYGPVEYDKLILHSDGRLEQHLKLRDGTPLDSERGHWEFYPPSNVFLEEHWDFHFDADQKQPKRGNYSLIVEFISKEPPIIVVDPDDNCFYEKSGKPDAGL